MHSFAVVLSRVPLVNQTEKKVSYEIWVKKIEIIRHHDHHHHHKHAVTVQTSWGFFIVSLVCCVLCVRPFDFSFIWAVVVRLQLYFCPKADEDSTYTNGFTHNLLCLCMSAGRILYATLQRERELNCKSAPWFGREGSISGTHSMC